MILGEFGEPSGVVTVGETLIVNERDMDTNIETLDERIDRLDPKDLAFRVPDGAVAQVLPLEEDESNTAKSLIERSTKQADAPKIGRFRLKRPRADHQVHSSS